MKLFFVLLMLTSLAFAKEEGKKETPQGIGDKARALIEDKPEEDCDDKAKKPVIIPEEPVLGLGTAGCSIEDM